MSVLFNGGGQRLVATNLGLTAFTVSCWAQRRKFDATFGDNSTLMADWNESGTGHSCLLVSSAGTTSFNSIDSGLSGIGIQSGEYGRDPGGWIHHVGVASAPMYAYANGRRRSAAGGGIHAGSNPFCIGARTTGDNIGTYMNGLIEHAAVWSVALNPDEIVAMTQGVLPIKIRPAKLWAYWPLTDEYGYKDISGNGRHLTVGTGPVPFSSESPFGTRRVWLAKSAAAAGSISVPFLPAGTSLFTPGLSAASPVGPLAGQSGGIVVS